ncbi:beta-lactamase family protein [Streptomyces sp. SID10853]|uniref:serine hydrolase domain-containing protein n=1 Tax=Streptomyces sp. SID10853 TaxID=2706028 RepID=UPI0013C24D1C|nr:serine hydrolase domain-containing protein [Streptomyces sp. SID10853]NDZ78303.1 beta-lactamase family protein [Streptomyces sp. SID10853]
MSRVPTCVLSSFDAPHVEHGHDLDRFVHIGSLTKPVTGTVLTCLAAEGRLHLDDPLERFLPVPSGTGITLRHLAEHTSGLPRLPPRLQRRDPYTAFDNLALDTVVRQLATLTTASPGQNEEYSNLGYAILGAALVAATETSYEDLVKRHVLQPLDITEVTSSPPAHRTLCRRSLTGRPRKPWTMNGAILPAGGLWATPRAAAGLVTALLVDRKLGEPAPSWQVSGPLVWHNGATRDASVFTGALSDGSWIMVHRLSGRATETDQLGIEKLKNR